MISGRNIFMEAAVGMMLTVVPLDSFAAWDNRSCAEAKQWAKVAAVQYTTGESKQYAMNYARELYRKSGGSRYYNEDAAAMTVDFTWRYMVNIGVPPSPPPSHVLRNDPSILNSFYESMQNDFFQWCVSQ